MLQNRILKVNEFRLYIIISLNYGYLFKPKIRILIGTRKRNEYGIFLKNIRRNLIETTSLESNQMEEQNLSIYTHFQNYGMLSTHILLKMI